jgi:hypothetical protein
LADLEYLESERKKLWSKLLDLEKMLRKKSSDFENESRESASRAKTLFEECQKSQESFSALLSEVTEATSKIRVNLSDVEVKSREIAEFYDQAESNVEKIGVSATEIEKRRIKVVEQADKLDVVFEETDDIVKKIEDLKKQSERSTELSAKVEVIHKSIASKKEEIDEIYYEIIGYTETDELTDKKVTVKGLKDELKDSYTQIKLDLTALAESFEAEKTSTVKNLDSLKVLTESDLKTFYKTWEVNLVELKKQIEKLLPNALTAGLSYAYSEKKDLEIADNKSYSKYFSISILGMLVISLIPFGVSINSLVEGTGLNETILRLPRLVLAILPLYVPVLWIAYSNNRKGNLSKRLIEEYSHKEVLSKTYEGLSKQISGLGDSTQENDLKNRLLFNILEVSAENPGKLISDYNKSDHPLMDALDKSVKLTDAVERLARIPGFTRIAASLSRKSETILERENIKASKGIDAIEVEG